jgi:hypothetical protein
MARYFFHIHDGTDRPDPAGTECPDLHAVRIEAAVLLGELVSKDWKGRFWQSRNWRVEVVDESGASVCELILSGQ